MTSKWIQSAPAASTELTSSPRRAKSADRIDGAMMMPMQSAHASRRAYAFVGFLDPLGFFLRHLPHWLRQAIGQELVRVMPAHLAPIRLDEFRIADAGVHFELC